MALGIITGSLVTIELSEAVLESTVAAGLLFVLGLLLVKPGHWLREKEGALRPFDGRRATAYCVIGVYAGVVVLGLGFFMLAAMVFLTGCDLRHGNALKAFLLLVVGLQSRLIFGGADEVYWSVGVQLALGSAAGAYPASLLTSQGWIKVWGSIAFSCSCSSWRSSTC